MKPTGKIFNLVLSLWAVAILWICIGTLVNFHQHKIWGKPLLPELLYAKRDKEQSLDLNKLIKTDVPKNIKPWNVDFTNWTSCPPSFKSDFLVNVTYLRTAEFIPQKRFILSTGLRAPPLS